MRVGGEALPVDRHRRGRPGERRRGLPLDRRPGPLGDRRGRPRAARRRRPRGRHARRRGARDDRPALARAGARAREQDRRSRAGVARAGVPSPRPRRPVPALGDARPRHRRPARRDRRRGSRRAASGGRRVGDEAIRVAILGRPNVGKSSLFNALLGAERTIVSEVPGTTRDAIDTVLERDGRVFQLIDTAGLRRKRRQRQGIDYYSELRALDAADRADVALVLVDASEGIVEGDLAAADVARKAQCSTLVVLSKWDRSQVTIEDVRPELQRRLRQRPPFITTSAITGRGISRVLDRVAVLFDKHAGRITTRRAEPLPRRAQGGPPAAGARQQAAEPALRRAGHEPAAAVPLHRQRHEPRHARLRLLGRERAARAVRARGRAGGDRLPAAVVSPVPARAEGGRRRRRLVGDGLLAPARRPGARGDPRAAERRGRADDPRDGPQPALPAAGRPARCRRDDDRGGAGRRRRPDRPRVAEPRVRRGRRRTCGRERRSSA